MLLYIFKFLLISTDVCTTKSSVVFLVITLILNFTQVNEIAEWLAKNMFDLTYDVLYKTPLADTYKDLREKFHVDGKPFLWQVRRMLKVTVTGLFANFECTMPQLCVDLVLCLPST